MLLFKLLSHVQLFCDPMIDSPPGSSVHGTYQTRILEWAAFHSLGDLPIFGIKAMSPALAGGFFTTELPWKHRVNIEEENSKERKYNMQKTKGKKTGHNLWTGEQWRTECEAKTYIQLKKTYSKQKHV